MVLIGPPSSTQNVINALGVSKAMYHFKVGFTVSMAAHKWRKYPTGMPSNCSGNYKVRKQMMNGDQTALYSNIITVNVPIITHKRFTAITIRDASVSICHSACL